MKASTVTAVTVVGGVIAAVVGLLTIPTLLGAKNAAASTGGGTFGGGPAAPEPSGGSSTLGGFFDWLGHLGAPAQSVPVVGASSGTAGTQTGYPINPGAVPVPGGGAVGPTSMPYIPGVTHPVTAAPPHPSSPTAVPRMNPRVTPTTARGYAN